MVVALASALCVASVPSVALAAPSAETPPPAPPVPVGADPTAGPPNEVTAGAHSPPEHSPPRWKWVFFGTSVGVTTLGIGVAAAAGLRTRKLHRDVSERVAESLDGPAPVTGPDPCVHALSNPNAEHSDLVYNASVGEVCRAGHRTAAVGNAFLVVGALGLASTIASIIVLHLPRRRDRTRARVSPTAARGFAGLSMRGRF
ncbi:MAG: hypothetical protein AAF721_26955 [Myxococcota bacterium]